MPGVNHEGLDELHFGFTACPFIQGNARGENGVVAIETVGPGRVAKPIRMLTLTRETLAILPGAGDLNPFGSFHARVLMPRVEIAQFELNFRLKLRVKVTCK